LTNKLVAAVTGVTLLCSGVLAQAQSAPASLCKPEGTVVAFFNGVLTTKKQADDIKEELARIHGTTDAKGEEIRYEVMYNRTGFLDDFLETFEQRLNEQDGLLRNRFELFFESMRGGGTWWSRITGAITSTTQLLAALGDDALAGQLRTLTSLRNNAPTQVNYQEHRSRIDNYVLEGKKMLFVAHSQGNLFANVAFDYASQKTPPGSVKLVHIAPASPTVRGQHVLAQLDLVINGLRLLGTVPSITDTIPGYLLRPAGANNQTDILGHGMFEIYINRRLGISGAVKNAINTALVELVAPPTQASSGFFTATLTWNGSGDVDTHVTEPDHTHVWYQNKNGHAGYLDVDNTSANGPEHYYASCDASVLQTGDYQIAVANYAAADGRRATVQIASYQDGVLGTKSVVLGAPTGDSPSATLFTVHVTRDANGRYSVTTN
jgi:hypothetical protein